MCLLIQELHASETSVYELYFISRILFISYHSIFSWQSFFGWIKLDVFIGLDSSPHFIVRKLLNTYISFEANTHPLKSKFCLTELLSYSTFATVSLVLGEAGQWTVEKISCQHN